MGLVERLSRKRRSARRRGKRRVVRRITCALRARKHGVAIRIAWQIVGEAHREGLENYPLAFALVEQESGFRNIFGCDLGPRATVPYCNQKVTRERVERLLAHIRDGGASNGVGLTQLTWPAYIYQAEREGGADRTRIQLRVGFRVLRENIRRHGKRDGIRRYNGSGPNAERYADSVLAREAEWRRRLGR